MNDVAKGIAGLEEAGALDEDDGLLAAEDEARRHAERLAFAAHADQPDPRDPYDGQRFGYQLRDGHYVLWSVGPDKQSGTADDILKTCEDK